MIVATGRMFRSVRPHLDVAGIEEPVVCYQGAAVVRPATGEFLVHRPIELGVALEAIEVLEAVDHTPNCYVDDELYVARHTDRSRAYADFQHIPVTEVGSLTEWLERPPTKLVAIGEPRRIAELRDDLRRRFDGSLHVTTSLPHFLELGDPGVSKATGAQFVADHLGFSRERTVAFGDGENDAELLQWSGYGVAVGDSHPAALAQARWTVPGPEVEGVAQVIGAYLASPAGRVSRLPA